MTITERDFDDIKVFDFNGRITYDTEETVKTKTEEIIKAKLTKVVFNLKDLSYVNSSGLGLLINVYKQVKSYKGELKLCGLRPELKELFKITSLDSIFDISDTEEECLKKFN